MVISKKSKAKMRAAIKESHKIIVKDLTINVDTPYTSLRKVAKTSLPTKLQN